MTFGLSAAAAMAVGVGGGMLVSGMLSDGPEIPDTSPTQMKAIEMQERVANKQLAQQDTMFNYFKDRQAKLDPLQEQVTERQLAMADETMLQGRDVFNYQKEVFRPVEQSLVAQAMRESTPEYYERYAQQAAATIAGQQQAAQGSMERNAASLGINPNSGAYAAASRGLQLENSAMRSAGMNDARDRSEALGWARKADVAGLGKGLVGAGNASYGIAQQGNTSALNGANETTRTAATTMGTPTQYGQMGIQAGLNMGNLANDIYRTQMSGYTGAPKDETAGMLGQAFGAWASTGFAT